MEGLLSPVDVHHSCKRKKSHSSASNSHPSIGILTRSKSRIYSHRNRSGISRPDPVPKEPKIFSPEIESVEALSGVNCNNTSRISSIKDLRSRRVFTPVVNSVLEEEEGEEADEEAEDRKKVLKISGSSGALDSNIGDSRLNGFEKSDIMLYKTEDKLNDVEKVPNLKDMKISGNGCNFKSKMAPNRRKKVFKTSDSFSYKRLLPHLMDIVNDESSVTKIEIIDAVIPCKPQKLDSLNLNSETMSLAEKSSCDDSKCVVPQYDDAKTEMPFSQHALNVAEKELGQAAEVIGASSIEKECVQTTPPDSAIFSNTEKLQTSKDSEKSNSHVLGQSLSSKSINRSVLNPCSRLRLFNNHKSLSFRRLLPFLINSSCDSGITQRPMPRADPIKDTIEQIHVNDIKTDITGVSLRNLPPSEGSSPETNNNPVSSEPLMPVDLHTAEKMPLSHNSDHTELEPCLVLPSSSTIDGDILNQQSTSKEPGPVGKQKGCLDLDMGLECHDNNGESIEASNAMVSAANGSCRGILKRNRRGCRGLCNCLNCASFRLHADRAFEFSRNQMLDAEEVASDLMSELVNLRLLLEKSLVSNNDLAAIQNSVVIKEACNNAQEAENVAKERLRQLNYDLDVHCRTPTLLKPKVTFANNIEERVIPVLDKFADTENKKG